MTAYYFAADGHPLSDMILGLGCADAFRLSTKQGVCGEDENQYEKESRILTHLVDFGISASDSFHLWRILALEGLGRNRRIVLESAIFTTRQARGETNAGHSEQHSPAVFIILVISAWGALRDRAYKKAGGVKPDRFENLTLLFVVGASVVVVTAIFLKSREAAGALIAVLMTAILGFWELYRWQTRRKNPIGQIRL